MSLSKRNDPTMSQRQIPCNIPQDLTKKRNILISPYDAINVQVFIPQKSPRSSIKKKQQRKTTFFTI